MKKIIVIPARLTSTRLPKKLLLELNGKTILQRVYEQCIKVKGVEVYIATDSIEIKNSAKVYTENIVMTKTSHNSGTDRIAEAVDKIKCNVVINVQGDEPFINPKLIENLLASFNNSTTNMASVMERISNVNDLKDPNVVKVVVDNYNKALFFSRAIIPSPRGGFEAVFNSDKKKQLKDYKYFKHVGIYGYKKDFLLKYSKMEESYLEKLEKLEQLRVLENGYSIQMIETKYPSFGIDTKEDYEQAKILIENGI